MQLLNTKLFIPPITKGLVDRQRLLELLDQSLSKKLTLLSSPAGFGKTTLICTWIAHRKLRAGWFSLDEKDNEPGRFVAYLVACLRSIHVDVDEQLSNVLKSPSVGKIENLMVSLINQLTNEKEKFIIVLDDYQVIANQVIHDLVNFLLENQPPSMHLVITSRTDPPLQLSRLRGRGQLTELRVQELRFNAAEGKAFLDKSLAAKLPDESSQLLVERTDGWISGLQMASLSLRHHADPEAFVRSFAGSHQYVFDYLSDEVLHDQPTPIVNFLYRTSILERMTGELCDAVTGLGSGADTLQWLYDINAFILPQDGHRRWYRYHPLFSDMLQRKLLQEEPELIPELHQRASRWFDSQGLAAEAVDHAVNGEDHEYAAALMERAADRTLLRGEIKRFISWIDRLDEAAVQHRPLLTLYHAECLLLTGMPLDKIADQLEGAAEHIGVRALMSIYSGDFQQSVALARRALDELPQESYFIRSAIASAMSVVLFMRGDIDQAVKGFEESVSYARQTDNLLLEVIGSTRIAQLNALSGKFHIAQTMAQHALDKSCDHQGRFRPVAGLPLYYMAYLDYLQDQLDAANDKIRQAIDLSDTYGGFWTIDCYLTLAMIEQARGRERDALDAIHRARDLARQTTGNPFDDLYSSAYEAQINLRSGNLSAAVEWAQARQLLPLNAQILEAAAAGFFHLAELEYMIVARLLIAQGDFSSARETLGLLAPYLEQYGRKVSQVELDILRAIAYLQSNDQKSAVHALEAAFDRMQPGQIRRFYLNEIHLLNPILAQFPSNSNYAGFIKDLQNRLEGPKVKHQETWEVGLVEALSAREMDVLRHLSSSQTIPEISSELFIAVSTLRTHIRNIYGKLGVHSRFEAVARARSLELIP